jgi:hypothetical protein
MSFECDNRLPRISRLINYSLDACRKRVIGITLTAFHERNRVLARISAVSRRDTLGRKDPCATLIGAVSAQCFK